MKIMKKIAVITLMISISISLLAQNLDQKKRELEKLNSQISKQKEIIEQTEVDKKKKKSSLNSTNKKKKEVERKIKKLQSSENKTKKELDNAINKLSKTTTELSDLGTLCQKEFVQLCYSHYESKLKPVKQVDCQLLASLIRSTAEEINQTEGKRKDLEKAKKNTDKKYKDLVWSKIVAKKKKNKYSKQMKTMESEIAQLEAKKKDALSKKEKLEKDAAALDELITKLQSDITTEKFTYKFSTPKLPWPVQGEVLRKFGEQKSDKYKVSIRNDGIDIKAKEGTPVNAVDSGVVAFAQWYNGAGKLVIINHKNGFYSLYSHNSSLLVSKGDEVTGNQPIALSGSTGSVEDPCVHFEIRKRGTPVNPMDYLE